MPLSLQPLTTMYQKWLDEVHAIYNKPDYNLNSLELERAQTLTRCCNDLNEALSKIIIPKATLIDIAFGEEE